MLLAQRFAVTASFLIAVGSFVSAGGAMAGAASNGCDDAAELTMLPSPRAPWKGAPLRVMVVTDKPVAGVDSIDTTKGAYVHVGDVIGHVGCTGNCTGPHLHFEVRRNNQPTDPEP